MLAPRAVLVTAGPSSRSSSPGTGPDSRSSSSSAAGAGASTRSSARHDVQQAALTTVTAAIPLDWRRGEVERDDLARFLFGPEDVVVAVGQDGLVANVAKYLAGQPVVGINPDPARNPGVLVPHPPDATATLLLALDERREVQLEERVMVEAALDDGQTLRALNEVYIGHTTHQSARYRIATPDGSSEGQSSSGVLVGTGTGATGWCRSAAVERHSPIEPAGPGGAGPLLVRAGGVAVSCDRHDAHRRSAPAHRAPHDHRRVGPRAVRGRHRGGQGAAHVGPGAHGPSRRAATAPRRVDRLGVPGHHVGDSRLIGGGLRGHCVGGECCSRRARGRVRLGGSSLVVNTWR